MKESVHVKDDFSLDVDDLGVFWVISRVVLGDLRFYVENSFHKGESF
jgi:hypothetical protein